MLREPLISVDDILIIAFSSPYVKSFCHAFV